jgi:hypothetical protein
MVRLKCILALRNNIDLTMFLAKKEVNNKSMSLLKVRQT